jgi:hypothetical protein
MGLPINYWKCVRVCRDAKEVKKKLTKAHHASYHILSSLTWIGIHHSSMCSVAVQQPEFLQKQYNGINLDLLFSNTAITVNSMLCITCADLSTFEVDKFELKNLTNLKERDKNPFKLLT